MTISINKTAAASLELKGRGGKEKDILAIFPTLTRKNDALYDCEDTKTNNRYELKKQENLQWFDPTKYHNINHGERKIGIIFILINRKGRIDKIAMTSVADFLNALEKEDPIHWSKPSIQMAHDLKSRCPSYQVKAPIKIRNIIEIYSHIFELLF